MVNVKNNIITYLLYLNKWLQVIKVAKYAEKRLLQI